MRAHYENKWEEFVGTTLILYCIGVFFIRRCVLCVVGLHEWHSPQGTDTWCFFCEKPRSRK